MPNTTKPLTATEVKQAKRKPKEYNLADGGGLYLRVKPNGTKLWIFNYSRPFTKKRANISLGTYPKISLADAREERLSLHKLLAKDIDPKFARADQNRKKREAHTNTFEFVACKWLKKKKPTISDSYYKMIINRLEMYIFPRIGAIPVHLINAVDTIEAIEPIAEAGKLETVKKLCRWINEVMDYSVNTGLAHPNPLSGIRKAFNAPSSTKQPTLKPEELPELMDKLNKASIKPVTRYLIEWQLLTLVRPVEASSAKWDEIDMAKRLWIIPPERMKGRKNLRLSEDKRQPHYVPLSDRAIEILETLKPISGHREYVFPSDIKPRSPTNSQTANMALKRAGFKGRLTSHGLRSLGSTILNEQQFPHDVIEAALAHADPTIRGTYNRAQYLEQRRVMLEWWSDHITAAQTGEVLEGKKHLTIAK